MVLLDHKKTDYENGPTPEHLECLAGSTVAIVGDSVQGCVAAVLQGEPCALVRDQFDGTLRFELDRYISDISVDITYQEPARFFEELHRDLTHQSIPKELVDKVVESLVTITQQVQAAAPDQAILLSAWTTATTAQGEDAFDAVNMDARMFHFDGSSPDRTLNQDGRLIMTIAGPVATTFVPPQICPYTRDEVDELTNTLHSQDRNEAAHALKRLTEIINHSQPTNPGDALVFGEEVLHAPDLDHEHPRLVLTADFQIDHSGRQTKNST